MGVRKGFPSEGTFQLSFEGFPVQLRGRAFCVGERHVQKYSKKYYGIWEMAHSLI